MCGPWELNPQPFALLTQCSATEPQEHYLCKCLLSSLIYGCESKNVSREIKVQMKCFNILKISRENWLSTLDITSLYRQPGIFNPQTYPSITYSLISQDNKGRPKEKSCIQAFPWRNVSSGAILKQKTESFPNSMDIFYKTIYFVSLH